MKRAALLVGICVHLAIMTSLVRADPGESVVRVSAFTRFPNPLRPWEKPTPVEGIGSGIFIGGNRILTNAHVVKYASEIYVQWTPNGEKGEAKIQALSVDLDLAVLTVSTDKFFDKRKLLPRNATLPKIKDAVTTFGFPRGGAGLSVTKGEVSRINSKVYGNEGYGLEIQISAAVNPGNSGGPAVVGDKMIGVVTSSLLNAQNTNYVIPVEEVEYFLNFSKDGPFTGKPRVKMLLYQAVENEALRRLLKVEAGTQGVLVVQSSPDSPVKELDILTKIGDHAIDNRGNIQLTPELSTPLLYMVSKLARDKSVPVTVRRGGKSLQVNMPVQHENPFLIKSYDGAALPYFIHGPLVFVPARLEDIRDFYAGQNGAFFSYSPLNLRYADHARFAGEELVVISAQFRHKVSNGYGNPSGKVVQAINGTTIKNLRHLVETVRDSKGDFLKIEFAEKTSELLVFDRKAMEAATEQILEDAGIAPTRRGSADLMAVWKGK